MSGRRHIQGPQFRGKGRHNLDYLQRLESKKMPPIFDAMGMPANGQPQMQQPTVHPVAQVFLQMYLQTLGLLTQKVDLATFNSEDVADESFDLACRAFGHLGFKFIAPLGFQVIAPTEPDRVIQ
jgi:hypothetical protein